MTLQEYYNLLVQSATDGTFPSTEEGICLYRKDRTKNCKVRCAIGLLLPDHKYDPSLEGKTATQIHHILDLPIGLSLSSLPSIQRGHDASSYPYHKGVWKASKFIRIINELPCFSKVIKADPTQFGIEGVSQ